MQGTRVIVDATSTIDITETMTTIIISTEVPTSSTVSLPSVSRSIWTLGPETLATISTSTEVPASSTGPVTLASTDYVTYTLESVTDTTEL